MKSDDEIFNDARNIFHSMRALNDHIPDKFWGAVFMFEIILGFKHVGESREEIKSKFYKVIDEIF